MNDPDVTVTHINHRWHARLIVGGEVFDEMACELKCDIGFICREMYRWYDKTGGVSQAAAAARHRHTRPALGRIWYRKDLK